MTKNLIKKSKRTTKTVTKAPARVPTRDSVWVTLGEGNMPTGVFTSRDIARDSGLGVVHKFSR